MGAERKSSNNAVFLWKSHDNKIPKVEFLLLRNFVVIAQAPKIVRQKSSVHYLSDNPLACSELSGKLPQKFLRRSAIFRRMSNGMCQTGGGVGG